MKTNPIKRNMDKLHRPVTMPDKKNDYKRQEKHPVDFELEVAELMYDWDYREEEYE